METNILMVRKLEPIKIGKTEISVVRLVITGKIEMTGTRLQEKTKKNEGR